MPDSSSPAATALEALGFALFVRDERGALKLNGEAPGWLRELWPAAVESEADLAAAAESPFLENFLVDAAQCWQTSGKRVRSGPWVERDVQLEASALTTHGRALLLIERLGEAFEAKKDILQKARETVIALQRLNSEMEKKEILLHCVAEDMTAALANIITSLRLLEVEHNPANARHLHSLAARATEEQQSLIHRVLEVFADDFTDVYGTGSAKTESADFGAACQRVLEGLAALFEEKRVPLDVATPSSELRVAAAEACVERIASKLLENALHTTPAGKLVSMSVAEDSEGIRLSIEDGGNAASSEICWKLFERITPTTERPSASHRRLHSCRILVENCGGEIGCEPGERGGTTLWVRLPKARPTP